MRGQSHRASNRGGSGRGGRGNRGNLGNRDASATPRSGNRSNSADGGDQSPFTRRNSGDGGDQKTFTPRAPRGGRGGRGGGRGGREDRESRGEDNAKSTGNSTEGGADGFKRVTRRFDVPEDVVRRYERLKEERGPLREKFIKEKRMNPEHAISIDGRVDIRGICPDMCPEFERVRRIVQSDLDRPEVTPETRFGQRSSWIADESLMVKKFSRSEAGKQLDMITDIRPPKLLIDTMKYMVARVDQEGFYMDNWVWDRSRQLRIDATLQDLRTPEERQMVLNLYEMCIRWHIVSMHQVAKLQQKPEKYDHGQDLEQCFKACKSAQDWHMDNRRQLALHANEAELWSLQILLNLAVSSASLQSSVDTLPEQVRQDPRVQTALQISREVADAYIPPPRVSELKKRIHLWNLFKSPSVTYLMACAVELSFTRIRHVVLSVLQRAASQKRTASVDWTLPIITEVMGFDSEAQAVGYCKEYGFSFGTTNDGVQYLDLLSAPTTIHRNVSWKPESIGEQTFSQKFVESKRNGRSIFDVVTQPADIVTQPRVIPGNDDSLFIPEDIPMDETPFINHDTTAPPPSQIIEKTKNIFGTAPASGSLFNTATSTMSPALNPFNRDASPKSSFGKPSGSVSSFGQPSGSLSNFGQPSASGPSFGQPSGSTFGTPATADKPPPFQVGKSTGTPTPTPFTTKPATAAAAQPGVFDPSKHSIKFGEPATTAPPSSSPTTIPFSNSATSQTTSIPSWPWSSSSPAASEAQTANKGFALPTSQGNSFSFTSPPTTSSASFFNGATAPQNSVMNTSQSAPKPDDQEHAKQQAQLRAQQEQERLDRETQARLEKEAKERREREEQEKRIRLEIEAKERERQAREEREKRERLEREAQERRAREEAIAQQIQERRRKEEAAAEALAGNIWHDQGNGLLAQWVESFVAHKAPQVVQQVRAELAEEKAANFNRYRLQKFMHKIVVHWQRKRYIRRTLEHGRKRRKWLKENRAMLKAAEDEMEARDELNAGHDNTAASMQGPSTRKTQQARTSESRTKARGTHVSVRSRRPAAPAPTSLPPRAQVVQKDRPSVPLSTPSLNNSVSSVKSSRESLTVTPMTFYKDPNPPVDRTDSEYFRLRAMGLSSTECRKRIHGYDSDEEESLEHEPKRNRTSATPTCPRQSSVKSSPLAAGPSPTASAIARRSLDMSQRIAAKVQAARELLNTTPSVNTSLIQAPASPTPSAATGTLASGNTITAKIQAARELMNTPVTVTSRPPHSSGFGASTKMEPLAYKGRLSRFLPTHLYGQGAAAVAAYNQSQRSASGRSLADGNARNLGPLELSSPIPTQQSYYPTQTQDLGLDEGMSAEEVVDSGEGFESEEEGEGEGEYEYEDEQMGYGEEYEEECGEEYEEEYEEEDMEVEQFAQPRQGPGATEEDAIELSD